mmetsp:Transcript_5141/g.13206  ORF Transcript_5141/g.13206 Transcript_5141/m.13206 type:complete len:206 (-) Transcript_5141:578-1195(-)
MTASNMRTPASSAASRTARSSERVAAGACWTLTAPPTSCVASRCKARMDAPALSTCTRSRSPPNACQAYSVMSTRMLGRTECGPARRITESAAPRRTTICPSRCCGELARPAPHWADASATPTPSRIIGLPLSWRASSTPGTAHPLSKMTTGRRPCSSSNDAAHARSARRLGCDSSASTCMMYASMRGACRRSRAPRGRSTGGTR